MWKLIGTLMRKHIYRHFLFLSLLGLMQFVVAGCSSSDEKEPLKPEGEDTPLEKDEYTFNFLSANKRGRNG